MLSLISKSTVPLRLLPLTRTIGFGGIVACSCMRVLRDMALVLYSGCEVLMLVSSEDHLKPDGL